MGRAHLWEVVLRELLLLQHGCALQRIRVDLLPCHLLVLLGWKRGWCYEHAAALEGLAGPMLRAHLFAVAPEPHTWVFTP